MTKHLSTVHEGKKPFECSICDYKCSQKGPLNLHFSTIHEGKKPFNCSICDYKCSVKGSLAKHIASIHESKQPFKCSICHFKHFSKKQSLTKHMASLHNTRNIALKAGPCTLFNKVFKIAVLKILSIRDPFYTNKVYTFFISF